MRILTALTLLVSPASAWDFTPEPICTMWHTTASAEVVVTFDPGRSLPYTITVALNDTAWPALSPYGIRFDGPRGLTISTDRHAISEDQTTIIVSDTGFDNVLNGLEWNFVATPYLGNQAVAIPLADAAPVVQKFRDCTRQGVS